MKKASPLEELARAMLRGAAFGCQQIQTTYYAPVNIRADGSHEYGFCAIGCASLGLLGRVPQNMSVESYHFGRRPLEQAFGVDWEMPTYLPEGTSEPLLRAVSRLNDCERWPVPHIAAWLLMLTAGWTVHNENLCWQADAESKAIILNLESYYSVVASITHEHWGQPVHPVWQAFTAPDWWGTMPEERAPWLT